MDAAFFMTTSWVPEEPATGSDPRPQNCVAPEG